MGELIGYHTDSPATSSLSSRLRVRRSSAPLMSTPLSVYTSPIYSEEIEPKPDEVFPNATSLRASRHLQDRTKTEWMLKTSPSPRARSIESKDRKTLTEYRPPAEDASGQKKVLE